MAWARVDDGWWAHPKVLGLSLGARGLWVTTLSWSCAQRKDIVPSSLVSLVGGSEVEIGELVATGLWEPIDEANGAWRIHDWSSLYVSDHRRAHVPAEVRRAVYGRDGHACLNCGSGDRLTIDHIVPRSLGGDDDLANYQTLCLSCNSRKRDAVPGDDSWRG